MATVLNKFFISLLLIAFALNTHAQRPLRQVLITGEVMNARNDTITVECFSGGSLIDKDTYVGRFYSLTLGEHKYYQIRITSGEYSKTCLLSTNMMGIEKIILDVDFASPFDSFVYLEKDNAKVFKMMLFDKRRTLYNEIERNFTEY